MKAKKAAKAAKKATPKKSPAKKAKKAVKAAAKKAPAKKKPAAKKAPAKKPAVKSPAKAAKKAAPKKAAARKAPPKKAAVKKAAPKKTALKKAPARKAAVKKAPAKKAAVKKAAPKPAAKPVALRPAPAPQKPAYEGAAAELVNSILAVLDDAKAENTVAINLEGRSTMADAMVVTTGRVNRHVAAIADQLLGKLKDKGVKNLRVEGLEAGDWCLVDTGDVIIHIFRPEVRAFYNLEKLWSLDAPKDHG